MRIALISVILYIVVFCLAYLASTATFEMQRHISAVSTSIQKALRLTAIHMLEASESIQLHQQASYEEYEAKVLEQESQQLQARGEWEHDIYAQQQRQRGEFLLKLSVYEQNKANMHWHNVERDQELHQQIMANVTLDTERHEETLQELQNKMQNAAAFCNMTSLFSSLCNAIGGVTSLQEKSDHEALLLQKEWNNANEADQDEVMELTVAKLLQHQADEYKNTSEKLLAAAKAWDERAQVDYERSRLEHLASQALQATANELEHQAQREEEWNVKNTEMVHLVLIQAQSDHVAANWKAIQGILCAAIVLIILIPRAMNNVHVQCTALAEQQGGRQRRRPGRQQHDIDNASSLLQLPTNFGHGVSAFVAHVLIFLLIFGSKVGDYLVSLQYHDIPERAVIILWFAAVAAACHVLILHGIRAVYTEMTIVNVITPTSSSSSSPNNTITRRDWSNVCWQLGKRFVVLLILFIMEVLFCWLLMGNTLLFQASVVAFLSTWVPFRFCALALLTWHVVCMDLEHLLLTTHVDDDNEEESTVWLSVNHRNNYNNGATEVTPLNKQEILSVTTPIDIYRATEPPPANATTITAAAGSNHHRCPPMMQEEVVATTGSQDDGTMTTLTTNTLRFESTATKTTTSTTTLPPPPRHYYSLYRGFSNLLLPLEIFLITCMVTIISTDLQVVWHSKARIVQCLALFCVVVLLILACFMIQRWTTVTMGGGDDDDKTAGTCSEIMMASSSDINGPLLLDHDHDDSYNVSSHKTPTHYSFIDSINPYKNGNRNHDNFGMFSRPQNPHYELVAV
jgi:hypothetical protein